MGARTTAKAKATRQALLEAGAKVIGAKGYASATMDDIVKEAGVSKGLAYYHFKNKAAMAACVMEDQLEGFLAQLEQVADCSQGGLAALEAMGSAFAHFACENQPVARFLASEMSLTTGNMIGFINSYEKRLIDLLASCIQRGIAEGGVDPNTDVEFHAVAMLGAVLTTALYFLDIQNDEGGVRLASSSRNLAEDEFAALVAQFARRTYAIA
ncbi:MAG: TetR/AcrR family transcriptional regulator [Coriobacteriia bacterium]|nr:TetR/AcrR family transcriptional regulator [Coriobacteriia bacterium]